MTRPGPGGQGHAAGTAWRLGVAAGTAWPLGVWLSLTLCLARQFEADRRAFTITLNSFGTELSKDDRETLYPTCGLLHPEGLRLLAQAEDFEQMKRVADHYGVRGGPGCPSAAVSCCMSLTGHTSHSHSARTRFPRLRRGAVTPAVLSVPTEPPRLPPRCFSPVSTSSALGSPREFH